MIQITEMTNNRVTISWEKYPDADGYEIFWSIGNCSRSSTVF